MNVARFLLSRPPPTRLVMRFIYASITNATCDAVRLRVHHQRDPWHGSFSRVCHQHGSPMAIRLTELLGSATDPLRHFPMVRSTFVDSQASTTNAFILHSGTILWCLPATPQTLSSIVSPRRFDLTFLFLSLFKIYPSIQS